jgi:hypothetical protein
MATQPLNREIGWPLEWGIGGRSQVTEVGIDGTEFTLDGTPTYPGRLFEGTCVQGLLFNVRAVQAIFDDADSVTRAHWAYPDTEEWDPERNTGEFCASLPSWRHHGVLAFTVNFQGGGPLYSPSIYERFDNNAFTPEGGLKLPYADRLERVLDCADELGMIVIVGLFYWRHVLKMRGERSVWRAAYQALEFLKDSGHRNLLIEIANETDARFGYECFVPAHAHKMIEKLRADHPEFLYSTSLVGANLETGRGLPPPSLVASADYVLLHGNGTRPVELTSAIEAVQAMPAYERRAKPIVINEDSPGIPNMEVAWRSGVSWGYFDQGYGGQGGWSGDAYVDYQSRPRERIYDLLSGFQTPPVNWTINTDLKRAFFSRVAEITGHSETAKRVKETGNA